MCKMKKLVIVGLALLTLQSVSAQTWGEFFSQKKTQKRYLLEQIAALKVYAGYVVKGITVAREGLGFVQNTSRGDFNLHRDFFYSLSLVSPRMRRNAKVADIIAMQVAITRQAAQTIRACRNSHQLSASEFSYLQSVFGRLLEDSAGNLEELISLITSGRWQLKDGERLQRIDRLYDGVQDQQTFVQSFSRSARGLVLQRKQEAAAVRISKQLNALP